MDDTQPPADDRRIDSTTRRGALAALAGGGVLAAFSGGAQADVGGGSESNELSHLLSRTYVGDEGDLPDPGVADRFFLVLTGGSTYDSGDLLRDTGSSWQRVDLGLGSVSAESLDNIRFASQFDGADGGEQIQAAVNSLPSDGGVVFIEAEGPDSGQWLFSSTVNINKNNVTVQGAGLSTYLKLADGADAVMFDFTGQDNITFRNFEIDGNRANQTNDGPNHVQLLVSNGGSDRILVENINAHDAVNNFVNAEVFNAVHGKWTVRDCWVDNNYDGNESGFRPGEDGIELKHCEEAVVEGCYLSGFYKTAVEIERSKYVSISGNVVRDSSYNAAAIVAETAGADDAETSQIVAERVTIANNILHDLHNSGIVSAGGRAVSISGNVITGMPDTGFKGISTVTLENAAKNITISNNVVDIPNNTSDVGIGAQGTSENIAINGNVVVGGKQSILATSATATNITGNIANGSDVDSIAVLSSPGSLVSSNIVKNSGADGIRVESDDVTVSDNNIEGATSLGIHVPSGNRVTTRDNQLDNTTGFGVRYDGTGTGEILNNVFKNASAGIRTDSDGNLVLRNILNGASVLDGGSNNEYKYNEGFLTENSGSASKSDGDTIAHGMDETPTYVNLTASADKHIAVATAVGGTNITVGLHDDTGSAVTSDETIYWEAKAR